MEKVAGTKLQSSFVSSVWGMKEQIIYLQNNAQMEGSDEEPSTSLLVTCGMAYQG